MIWRVRRSVFSLEQPGDAQTLQRLKTQTVERDTTKRNDAVMAPKQGKIDCVVIDSEPAKKFVEKNDDLEIVGDILTKEEYAICLSKDNADLTKEFNEGSEGAEG